MGQDVLLSVKGKEPLTKNIRYSGLCGNYNLIIKKYDLAPEGHLFVVLSSCHMFGRHC